MGRPKTPNRLQLQGRCAKAGNAPQKRRENNAAAARMTMFNFYIGQILEWRLKKACLLLDPAISFSRPGRNTCANGFIHKEMQKGTFGTDMVISHFNLFAVLPSFSCRTVREGRCIMEGWSLSGGKWERFVSRRPLLFSQRAGLLTVVAII